MEQGNLYQPFEIFVADMDSWKQRPLVLHFFEIIHILEGTGTRIVNRNRFPYRPGSVFLFTPLDCRGFESETPTRFCSIRFSEVFLGQCKTSAERDKIGNWLKQLEHIFFNHNRSDHILITQTADCKLIVSLMSHMIAEYGHKHRFHEENMQHFVTLLLNIIARNVGAVSGNAPEGSYTEPLINRMILHIRRAIYHPEKLKLEYLAAHFNLSVNYIGEYFKKQTGESLQQYLVRYKMKLVEQRLTYSALTISQIADELGFTDESHLSRLFKKHAGVSPSVFRKQQKQLL